MTQVHVAKNRSYRRGKGEALDALNERLADKFHDDNQKHMVQVHPTKGFRYVSAARLKHPNAMEQHMHGWARLAARITGSSIGGAAR